jgi:hypothetical protein
MENNMNSIQLEDIVKNNLANYEARYDANDWSRMEGLLGAAPDSSSFNWKPVLIIFILCIFLGGGYSLYTYLDFSGSAQKPSLYTPPAPKKTVVTPAKKIVPVITTPPADTIFKDEHLEEPVLTPTEEVPVTNAESKPEKEKVISEEEIQRKKEESEARRARRKALAAANDSAKGTDSSGATRKNEKNTEKKEKAKSTSTIGFNIFSTINADSLKKYQERLKKDSVK